MGENDNEESTPCATRYGFFVKIMALICGILQCVVGVIQVFEAFNQEGYTSFCDSLPVTALGQIQNGVVFAMSKQDVACIGPQIRWVKSDSPMDFDFTSSVNGMPGVVGVERMSWRGVFFKPKILVDLWTPIFFGALSIFLHMGQTRSDKIADNWLRFSMWFLIQAAWGSFGYAGNIGIITGFFGVAVSFFSLLALCIAPNVSRTLDLHGVLGMLHIDSSAEK